jgi:hypothetical protein
MLIDYTYFQNGLIAIPNLADEVIADLQFAVAKYEPLYLEKVLGRKLYREFMAGLEADPIEQKWLDLRDGAEYNDGESVWRGFQNEEKISPIANYVFVKFATEQQSVFTGIGEAKPSAENSTIITVRARIASVWSEMAVLNTELYGFLSERGEDYPAFTPWDFPPVMLEPDNLMDV